MPGEFIRFAFADKRGRTRGGHLLHPVSHNIGSGSNSQFGKFLQ